jgi:hypothetical protein
MSVTMQKAEKDQLLYTQKFAFIYYYLHFFLMASKKLLENQGETLSIFVTAVLVSWHPTLVSLAMVWLWLASSSLGLNLASSSPL